MPHEIPEMKRIVYKDDPGNYHLFKVSRVVIDDSCKTLEAFLIDEFAFGDMSLHLQGLDAVQGVQKVKHGNFRTTMNKDSFSMTFEGDLNDAVIFLRWHSAISKHTEEQLLNHLNTFKNAPSATIASRTPSTS
jgi:hypothetical protein